MGLISRIMLGKPPRDGVPGTAYVHSRTHPPRPQPKYIGGAKLNLVVSIEGRPPYKVVHRCTAPSDRYPHPGQTVPVTVSARDPERLRVDWERLTSAEEAFARLDVG